MTKQPSRSISALIHDVAAATSLTEGGAQRTVRAVLAIVAEQLPVPARSEVLAQFPDDLARLLHAPRRSGAAPPVACAEDLIAEIADLSGEPRPAVRAATSVVLSTLARYGALPGAHARGPLAELWASAVEPPDVAREDGLEPVRRP